MTQDRKPSIVPLNFWVDYKVQPDGTRIEEHRVEWTRKGQMGSTTQETIERLQRDPNNPIWLELKPYYDNWRAGKEAPVDGTPLAAWPGATPQLVKALEPLHVRSVEDLAEMNDGTMERANIPGIRGIRQNARAFVEAQKTTAVVAGQLSGLQARNENLEREVDELKGALKSLAAEKGIEVVDDKPKKRGRRKKAA